MHLISPFLTWCIITEYFNGVLDTGQFATREACHERRRASCAAAAKRTDKSEPFIRRGLKNGTIKGVKLGRDWFVIADEVDRLAIEFPLEPVGV